MISNLKMALSKISLPSMTKNRITFNPSFLPSRLNQNQKHGSLFEMQHEITDRGLLFENGSLYTIRIKTLNLEDLPYMPMMGLEKLKEE